MGRMAEPSAILRAIATILDAPVGRLTGRSALVTSGPTVEAIDPVRYLTNRSSGKQGHAVAAALARLGARTILVSGPTAEPDPPNVEIVRVESAVQMLEACRSALPVDIAVCAAAVSDWRVAAVATTKLKKGADRSPPRLELVENPDILATLSKPGPQRPRLVVGFALETDALVENARAKLRRKGCDWIVANAATQDSSVFGSSHNAIVLIKAEGQERWPRIAKSEVGLRLAAAAADFLGSTPLASQVGGVSA
jgi:phosphopantothenoylcysteine decarboxylase/phosphopantothenate--cysteine ligase